MNVYAESNFVLELALRQEDHDHCERILQHAEAERIQLLLPAYSLAEPYQTWHRRGRHRDELREKLEDELAHLSRSEPYARLVEGSSHITALLSRSIDEEKKRLDFLCRRLVPAATILELTETTIDRSLDFQTDRDLSPPDSIVYASVLGHLRSVDAGGDQIFVTRDPEDFLTPDIEEELGDLGARVIPSFADARALIDTH